MRKRNKKKQEVPIVEESARIAVAQPPKLPEVERAFFDLLLRAVADGLLDTEKLARKLPGGDDLLRRSSRARATAAYGLALLRLEEIRALPAGPQEPLADVFNAAVNHLRREFLYAGVALRRPDEAQMQGILVPGQAARFLLEELLCCCLRCAPEGKNLHITAKRIGGTLLLSLRTEGAALRQAPLIPLIGEENAPEDDYGFGLCGAVAALLGWEYRWEADEAGVRMFVDIAL